VHATGEHISKISKCEMKEKQEILETVLVPSMTPKFLVEDPFGCYIFKPHLLISPCFLDLYLLFLKFFRCFCPQEVMASWQMSHKISAQFSL